MHNHPARRRHGGTDEQWPQILLYPVHDASVALFGSGLVFKDATVVTVSSSAYTM